MKSVRILFGCFLVIGLIHGCGMPEKAEYLYPCDLSDISLHLYSENMGIHPDKSVLHDPNNPFVPGVIGDQVKWSILDNASNVAAFYCWATKLARIPMGEHQYYTGVALKGVYENREASNEQLEKVRNMAIRAFQAVLDHFPESVSWDASGTYSFRLAPLAFNAILDLGGTVEGGWIQVSTPDGGTTVIQVKKD